MNIFARIGSWLKSFGKHIDHALEVAVGRGLTDAITAQALAWVKEAALKQISNDEKRVWVVSKLVALGVPESIARLATELAVQLLKKELAQVGGIQA